MNQIRTEGAHTGLASSRLVWNVAVTSTLVIAMLFGATASAQTYTDIHDFDGSKGSTPSSPQLLVQGRDGNLYGTTPYGGNGSGVVFQITPAGALSIIYNFDGPNGARPDAGLTMGTDGNFYGTTLYGGTANVGTIFQITPGGTHTLLYSFTGGSDGDYPYATPSLGADGNLYGVTQAATAYKITPAGKFTLLGSIPERSFAPLVLASDGNFYGTTQRGGSLNAGTVFKMTPAGKVSIVYSFDNTHGSAPWAGVVQGADGNLYGTTTGGGTVSGGVVFRLTRGGSLKVLHNFPTNTSNDGHDPVAGVVAATDGNVYGATFAGGSNGLGVYYQVTAAGKYSVLYNFDKPHGSEAGATAMQHTNSAIYGLTGSGGSLGDGVVYSLGLNTGAFVKLVLSSGKVGTTAQILGSGFNSTTKVTFNGTPAIFTVVSDTYMTAKVPAGATSGTVMVTTSAGPLASSTQFQVIPKIMSFTPTSGPVGTQVVIKGNSFTAASKVTFGGVKAIVVSVDSDSQITATVPTGAKTGKIAVTTPGGTGTSTGVFTVTQ